MRLFILIATLFASFSLAAPMGYTKSVGLVVRDGAGSTSTSASGGSGPLSGLLIGGMRQGMSHSLWSVES
jgi:hypothetical protein